MTGTPFALRALEMHGDRMWSWSWAKRAIDLAAAHGMNALVLHRNDILDMLAFPQHLFSAEEIWARWPVRYHQIDNNRQYLRHLLRHVGEAGLALYLEVKEISFHWSLLHRRPELWRQDAVCASDPFWWAFLEAKVEEVLEALPALAGMIVSPATRETRVTIAANECECPRCRATVPEDWYAALIGAMFRPLDARGKTLAVRDFSYGRGAQGAVLRAAGRVSPRVVVTLKNTPHDYYPTFPDNPRIGDVGAHPQWIEFDTWGQFFGLGVFPAITLADTARRLRHAAACGASGIMARTDWEGISDGSVLDSLNLANLTGLAALARDLDQAPEALIARALEGRVATALGGGLDEAWFSLDGHPEMRRRLAAVLGHSWDVMRRTVFVLRHVFHEDCMFPDTVRKAQMMLTEVHGLAEWDASAVGALEPEPARIAEIFAEKDAALSLAEELAAEMSTIAEALPDPARWQLRETADLWVWYVRGFRHAARAFFATLRALRSGAVQDGTAARQEIRDLDAYKAALERRLQSVRPMYLLNWLLDTGRLARFGADLRATLGAPGRHPALPR